MTSTAPSPIRFFIALFSTIFFVTFNYTLTLIAGPYIGGDLGASHDIASYSTTFYAIGNAIAIPIGSFLIGRFRLSQAIFTLLLISSGLSFLAICAPNYPILLCLRLLQGVFAGPLFPMIFTLISHLGPPDKKAHFVTIFLTIFTVVPSMSACIGGVIAYEFDWRWLFLIDLFFTLILALPFAQCAEDRDLYLEKKNIDWIGYFSFMIAISTLLLAIILGQQLDWLRSRLITSLFLVGIPFLIFFVMWEWHHPSPVLDLRLFKNRIFSFALFNLTTLFSAYFGMVILLSQWLNLTVHYTPYWIALIMGTMSLAGLFPVFLILKGLHKIDTRIPLFIAISLFLLSCFHAMFFNEEINFGRVALSRIAAGFGFALFLPPIFRLCFRTFSEDHSLNIVSLFQVTRIISTGVGASIYTTLWERRQVFYHERLGSRLTKFSELTRAFFEKARFFRLTPKQSEAQLNDLLDRQAIALALNDCFYLMCWLMVMLLVLIALSYFLRQEGFIPEKDSSEAEGKVERLSGN